MNAYVAQPQAGGVPLPPPPGAPGTHAFTLLNMRLKNIEGSLYLNTF